MMKSLVYIGCIVFTGISMNMSPIIVGHRGACGYEPENSLRSFERAIACGVDMIECDVRRCASGELVLIHDSRVDRTSSSSGYVHDLTLDQLKTFSFQGDHILTVQELLHEVNTRVKINFEVKESGIILELTQLLIDTLNNKTWQLSDFIITSFIHQELVVLQEIYPEFMCGPLMACSPIGYGASIQDVAHDVVVLDYEIVSKAFVDDIHKRGKRVFVYPVNEPRDIGHMIALQVDGIISDYPDRVIELCKSGSL